MSSLPSMYGGAAPKPASEKQIATLIKMIPMKQVADEIAELGENDVKALTMREASQILDEVFNAPWKPRPQANRITEDGMYRTPDGRIFKVQKSRGSDRLYAKELIRHGDKAEFVYEPGLLRLLKPEYKMTLEQAKEYGALYGVCCVCAATLTKERSIAAGIGPICASKF